VLNYIGGDTWRSNGQWIEWDFEVPEDGYYHIMVKGRQNYNRGSVSSRSVLIDGEIPFAEMKEETGISVAALQKLVAHLIEQHYVERANNEGGWRVFITPTV
jgi:hypothetical protein